MTTTTPSRAKPLTPAQTEVLGWIRDYIAANQYAPTLQEIANALHKSKISIFEHVESLVAKGWITKVPDKSRSIRLVEDVCPHCGRSGH